jgi:hypothetical protein
MNSRHPPAQPANGQPRPVLLQPVHGEDPFIIYGAHAIRYSNDADATRAALAKVLDTRSVEAGGGWLIFALPPAELAVHPAQAGGRAELYLLCDDVAATDDRQPRGRGQVPAGTSSASSCWTRVSMSSRMRRTTSTGWPAGSSRVQSS